MNRVGIVAARSKDEARDLGEDVERWLVCHQIEPVPEERLQQEGAGAVDAIVVLGGDGLMMRAANAYPDVPLLGINFGNVGFLALVERRDWRHALEALVAGRFSIEESATLAATIARGAETLDEVGPSTTWSIRSGARMVDIEVYIDGHYVNTYPGDGMIVSTPHGSSAYCMAAGGPILAAGVRGFAIVPISCHSPIRMPFVVSEEATIELLLANDREATLILDGREMRPLLQGDVIGVRRGAHRFRLITLDSTNFYEAFRTKFNYKIRPDAKPTRDGKTARTNGAALR